MNQHLNRLQKLSPIQEISLSSGLRPMAFSQIKNWQADDHLAAFNCFRHSAERIIDRPYTTKSLGISSIDLTHVARLSMEHTISDSSEAQDFFETNFQPHFFKPADSSASAARGMLTGYYEPEHQASTTATEEFKFPIYARPDDLVDIDDSNRPHNMDAGFAFGQRTATGISKFHDRQQINNGVLSGLGLELFWLNDPVDVFFIHIQGSARLTLEDGSKARISYAAKSGHPYTPIGKVLADRGELELSTISMDTIRQWLRDNPDLRDNLLEENHSYIFFQKTIQTNPFLGPVAAAGVGLTPGRSIAVDHRLHTFATPVWVQTSDNFADTNKPLERLLISQDTGSAIIGPQRGDLFTGSGPAAGQLAGQLKHPVSMIVFVPNPSEEKYG